MRVMIAGVAGVSGRMVAERLQSLNSIDDVIGLDPRPVRPAVPGLRFVRADLRQPEWTPWLEGVDVVLHLIDWPHRRLTARQSAVLVAGSKHVLDAARSAAVPRVVMAHSAVVYGAQPGAVVDESTMIRGHQSGPFARALAFISDYAGVMLRTWDVQLVRLRSAVVCGPRHDTLARHLVTHPARMRRYADRTLQAIHEEDWLAAVLVALRGEVAGVVHAAADGLPFREVAALLGEDSVPVWPPWRRLRVRRHGAQVSPEWKRALYRGVVLKNDKLCAAGWSPQYTTQAALLDALD
jgi:nucleoside-diphosphate-sugar epimerase